MGKHCNPAWPSPKFIASTLLVDQHGDLRWKARPKDNGRHTGRLAGSLRPDGRRFVSIRFAGRMRTYLSDRVIFVLKNKRWPTGVVEFDSERLVDRPKHSRSPGRRGGLKAEKARDQAALEALESGAMRLVQVAEAVGGGRSNVRRRLVKLASLGLVEAPPRCCPDRGWLLTRAGKEAVLIDTPAPPAPAVAWVRPLVVVPPCADLAGNGMRLVARYG